jgi:hypothetical protein
MAKLPPSGGWRQGIGLMVDRQGAIEVSHRAELLTRLHAALRPEPRAGGPAPLVMELDPAGNVVQSWGDPRHRRDYPPVLHKPVFFSFLRTRTGIIWSNRARPASRSSSFHARGRARCGRSES